MCFSPEADVVVGLAILPVGVLALREVRVPRELLFAALPLLLAAHQLVEAVVWTHADGPLPAGLWRAAVVAYLVVALPLLPVLLPTAVLLLEPPGRARARVAPFVLLGLVVSAYLTLALAREPVSVLELSYGLRYETGVENGLVWAVLYVVAAVGPSLASGYRSVVAFGAANLVGALVVATVWAQAFASLWCALAAVSSVLVLVHMRRRRRLPDADRFAATRRTPVVPI